MRKFIKIAPDDCKISFNVKSYLSPDYIYLPLEDNMNIVLNEDRHVLKGEFINNNQVSYVSGKACGIMECLTYKGRQKCLIVENDYNEQNKSLKAINENGLLKFLSPKLKDKLVCSSVNLVFSIIEDEPLVYTYSMIINNHYQELLDTIKFLNNNVKYKNIFIVIKDNEKKNIESLINTLGIYPDLKLVVVPNVYPILNTDYLKNLLNIDDYVLLNPEDLMEINNTLRMKKIMADKYITISGDNMKPFVVNVKIGVKMIEVLDYFQISWNDRDVYLNGPISGKKIINMDDLIITKDVRAISLLKKENSVSQNCISCGMCKNYCPVNINPKYIFENKTNISQEYLNKCIKCGLCTYICPSNIDLKSVIEGGETNEN